MTPEQIAAFHTEIHGSAPTPLQSRLYDSYPMYRGYSSLIFEEIGKATLTLALLEVVANDIHGYCHVMICHPSHSENQFRTSMAATFNTALERPDLSKKLTKALSYFEVVNVPIRYPDEPQRWVSLGFQRQDPLPDWLGVRLLSLETP